MKPKYKAQQDRIKAIRIKTYKALNPNVKVQESNVFKLSEILKGK